MENRDQSSKPRSWFSRYHTFISSSRFRCMQSSMSGEPSHHECRTRVKKSQSHGSSFCRTSVRQVMRSCSQDVEGTLMSSSPSRLRGSWWWWLRWAAWSTSCLSLTLRSHDLVPKRDVRLIAAIGCVWIFTSSGGWWLSLLGLSVAASTIRLWLLLRITIATVIVLLSTASAASSVLHVLNRC